MNLKATIALCLLGATAASLPGHDLYVWPETFRPSPGQVLLVELHNGDSFPESEGPPALSRLCDTNLVTAAGSEKLADFHEERKALVKNIKVKSAGSFVLTACLSAYSRSYDAPKFAKYLEDEGLTMVAEYRKAHHETDQPVKEIYSKYAKAILASGRPTGFATRPLGMKFEIVPAADPATLRAGQFIAVQVLFEGHPAAGLRVDTAWLAGGPAQMSVAGTTGPDGRIRIPLQRGKCRITTGRSDRGKDQSTANWETYFATLTFAVEAGPTSSRPDHHSASNPKR